jgi:hypothetical protein
MVDYVKGIQPVEPGKPQQPDKVKKAGGDADEFKKILDDELFKEVIKEAQDINTSTLKELADSATTPDELDDVVDEYDAAHHKFMKMKGMLEKLFKEPESSE